MEPIGNIIKHSDYNNGIDQFLKKLRKENTGLLEANKELTDKISKTSKENLQLSIKQNELIHKHTTNKMCKSDLVITNEYLRQMIIDRSQLIDSQEIQLKEYAFINSHILRSPVLTLKGLLNLLKISTKNGEEETIKKHMNETVKKLDNIIVKMAFALNNRAVLHPNFLG